MDTNSVIVIGSVLGHSGALIVGSPAACKRMLSAEEISGLQQIAHHYAANAQRFKATLRKLGLAQEVGCA
jgi:carbonic anhydrase/acetyltransferase-like protein (isoleucine patch superfamily)